MDTVIQGKTILVTGACGTVGSEIVQYLLGPATGDPARVVAVDNNESELFFLKERHQGDSRFMAGLADIRDCEALRELMVGCNLVFHAAALKHVTLCEGAPFEAVQTNIHGVQNVIRAAASSGVERVVFTSSDKAVNPTNVMGTSKLMGERLMTAANGLQQSGGCMFLSTRFGNVLGSNGSVIPLFHQQIRNGGPITLTHPDMTRFIMSIEEAVRLVIDSAGMACGGEVFVTKMPVARIEDLAVVMRDEIAPMYGFRPDDIPIEVTGPRPGEKMFEELMSEEETRRAIELERYFSVLPTFRGWKSDVAYEYEGTISTTVDNPYSSRVEPSLSRDDLHAFLIHNQLLGFTQQETPPSQPADMLPEVKTVTASEQLVS